MQSKSELNPYPKPFEVIFNFPDRKPPVRAYLLKKGLVEAYGTDGSIAEAREHITNFLNDYEKKIKTHDFVLAFLGLIEPDEPKLIEIFGVNYRYDNPLNAKLWPGDSLYTRLRWTTSNGLHVPQTQEIPGHLYLAIGGEETYRVLTAKSLKSYINKPPYFTGLEPAVIAPIANSTLHPI
ncbi:MAG: hypothetical protein NT129_03865 [Candidatus Aenigmarchaeota archaeon]|nr:hypothetical protein [Candidatus Aenigmarchaeota archaeon]